MAKPKQILVIPRGDITEPEPVPERVYHPSSGRLIPFKTAARLPEAERAKVYYEIEWADGTHSARWPFVDDVSSTFVEVARVGVHREDLEALGLTDETLQRENDRLFGRQPDQLVLASDAEDTVELQLRRKEVYDACSREWELSRA